MGDLKSMQEGIKIIETQFDGGILNCKDRIANSPASGYSDVLLNVYYENIVCEIQMHLEAFFNEKHVMHKSYKIARHFGDDFDTICFGKIVTSEEDKALISNVTEALSK